MTEGTNSAILTCWHIDLDWYKEQNRSFYDLAQHCLCHRCHEKFNRRKKKPTIEEVRKAIETCCSLTPEYINPRLPFLESVFRLFLANGNEPLDIVEINRQVAEKRGAIQFAPEKLTCILMNDQWYGLFEAGDKEATKKH